MTSTSHKTKRKTRYKNLSWSSISLLSTLLMTIGVPMETVAITSLVKKSSTKSWMELHFNQKVTLILKLYLRYPQIKKKISLISRKNQFSPCIPFRVWECFFLLGFHKVINWKQESCLFTIDQRVLLSIASREKRWV